VGLRELNDLVKSDPITSIGLTFVCLGTLLYLLIPGSERKTRAAIILAAGATLLVVTYFLENPQARSEFILRLAGGVAGFAIAALIAVRRRLTRM